VSPPRQDWRKPSVGAGRVASSLCALSKRSGDGSQESSPARSAGEGDRREAVEGRVMDSVDVAPLIMRRMVPPRGFATGEDSRLRG